MDSSALKLDHDDGVAIVTLNRPDRHNAWTEEMRTELGKMLTSLNADDAVRAVVLTGAGGKAFCSGQDFHESQQFAGGNDGEAWLFAIKDFYEIIRAMEKPTVAALNGLAAGSGFQVALMLDFRIGHASVTMGQPELNNGIPSVVGPWAVMADRIGVLRTIDLVLTGRLVLAQEAHTMGMINELVEPERVLARSIELAREIGSKPPVALKLTKRAYRKATQAGFDEAFEIAHEAQTAAFASGEPQRCMEEFFRIRAERKSK